MLILRTKPIKLWESYRQCLLCLCVTILVTLWSRDFLYGSNVVQRCLRLVRQRWSTFNLLDRFPAGILLVLRSSPHVNTCVHFIEQWKWCDSVVNFLDGFKCLFNCRTCLRRWTRFTSSCAPKIREKSRVSTHTTLYVFSKLSPFSSSDTRKVWEKKVNPTTTATVSNVSSKYNFVQSSTVSF